MKIHVGNFNTNMSDLLNQLNSENGLNNANAIYQKAMHDVEPKFQAAHQQLQKTYTDLYNLTTGTSSKDIQYVNDQNSKIRTNIQQASSNLRGFVQGEHWDSVNKLNQQYDKLWGHLVINGKVIRNPTDMIHAVQAEEKVARDAIGSEIQATQQFSHDVVNNMMPQYVQKQMQSVRDSFPTNMVHYYPPGQFPSSASVGDICWQSGNFNSNTNINARAYRYNGSQWIPVKVDADIFGDNIFGADIHGGTIYGANFVSEAHGMDGKANFSVSPYGDIYARNFAMDLQNFTTGSSVNRMTYNTMGDGAKGLNFDNGTLTMTASAVQDTGTYIKSYQGNFNAATYLEPDYLKLRSGTDPNGSSTGSLLGRTDLRGGNLELADQWGQDWGVRLGYWDDSTGNVGPLLAIENGVKLGYPADGKAEFDLDDWKLQEDNSGKLNLTSNDGRVRQFNIKNPVDISNGFLTVDGDTLVKGSDYGYDKSQINSDFDDKQRQLNHHNDWLSNHEQILTIGGQTQNGQSTRLDTHDARLDSHNSQLQNHQSEINNLQSQIVGQNTTINGLGQKVDIFNEKSLPNITDTSINLSNNRIWSNYQPIYSSSTSMPGTVWFYGDSGYVDIKAAGVYSNDSEINSDRSLKKDITPVDSKVALTQVLGTDIKSYRYKNSNENKRKNIGPIIDDQNSNSNQKYYTPNNLIDYDSENGDAFILNNAISYLFLSIQELEKQNSQLTQRVAKLEFEK